MATKKTKPPAKKVSYENRYQKSPYSIFEDTADALGLSGGDLSQLIGFGKQTYWSWRKEGQMPAVAAQACDYQRMLAQSDTPKGKTVIAVLELDEKTKMPALRNVLEAFCKTSRIIET